MHVVDGPRDPKTLVPAQALSTGPCLVGVGDFELMLQSIGEELAASGLVEQRMLGVKKADKATTQART